MFFFETDEESGARDTPIWIDHMKERIGKPDMVFILDSGAADFDHFYVTSSLRGNLTGTLSVKTINGGVHSGEGSGLIPDTFRILRNLLTRVENPETGVLINDLYVTVPPS